MLTARASKHLRQCWEHGSIPSLSTNIEKMKIEINIEEFSTKEILDYVKYLFEDSNISESNKIYNFITKELLKDKIILDTPKLLSDKIKIDFFIQNMDKIALEDLENLAL